MLKDLQGFYKRKLKRMNSKQVNETINELKDIIHMLENKK